MGDTALSITEHLLRSVEPFQALELSNAASENDIRKKFLRLSRLVHPDKSDHPRASEAFQRLTSFYEAATRAAAAASQPVAPPPAP
eukprot:4121212-Prymnesium_polylepis.1